VALLLLVLLLKWRLLEWQWGQPRTCPLLLLLLLRQRPPKH
jgi:hypothetical protein